MLLLGVACGDDDDTSQVAGGLADGHHFGFVVELDPARFRLVFDPAELLEGDEATAAAESTGAVITEGGAFVDNPDDRTEDLRLREDVVVRLLTPCCELHEVAFEDWLALFDPDERAFYGTARSHYRLTIEDGTVAAVDEQLVP